MEHNKAIVYRAFAEIFNQGNFDSLYELAHPDLVLRLPLSYRPEPYYGPEGVKEFALGLRAAFPDIHFEMDEMIASDDVVVVRWHTSRQTQNGVYLGLPPTGKQISVEGIELFRIAEGKVIEIWAQIDALGGMQQLGVVPPLTIRPFEAVGFIFRTIARLIRLGIRDALQTRRIKQATG